MTSVVINGDVAVQDCVAYDGWQTETQSELGLAATKASIDAPWRFSLSVRESGGFSERGVGTGPTRQNSCRRQAQHPNTKPGSLFAFCPDSPESWRASLQKSQLAPADHNWHRGHNGLRSDQGPRSSDSQKPIRSRLVPRELHHSYSLLTRSGTDQQPPD